MANRRRGVYSLPEELRTNERLSTKKELSQRRSLPPCPIVPMKPKRTSGNPNEEKPKPLFFTKCVALSPLYNPEDADRSYGEQCFYKMIPIGEGSFGKVYRARSRDDEELYAVKRQKPSISSRDIYAEVANNEKVGVHPNLTQFFRAWEEAGEVYLQLEYCDVSLTDYAHANSDIPEVILWDVLHDICQGLNHLHQRQLIHLDVKPGNIMMTRSHYKLSDFGTLVDLSMQPKVLRNLSDGDAKYLALEVLNGVYQPSCDIFGLGISVLELAADLELPNHGPLWQQLRHNILPIKFYDKVSLGLQVIIERMLNPKYAERPSAEKILKYSTMKAITKRDKKQTRPDYLRPYRNPVSGVVHVPLQLPSPPPANNNNNNNNNNVEEEEKRAVETPRCANNWRCLSANTNNGNPIYGNDGQGPSRILGRRSLFKLLTDDPEDTENRGGENGDYSLARNLEAAMDIDLPNEVNGNPEPNGEDEITSTPNIKPTRKMPKSKLTFE